MGDNRTLQLDRARGKAKVVSPSTRGAAARVERARKAAPGKPAGKKASAGKSVPKKKATRSRPR